MTPEELECHKRLILAALDLFPHWEERIETMTGPERAFNEQWLRLSKGLIKAWRLFLIEDQARRPI